MMVLKDFGDTGILNQPLVTSLPSMGDGGSPQVIYSIDLNATGKLAVGDLLCAHGNVGISCQTGINDAIGVWGSLQLSDSPTDNNGENISDFAGFNLIQSIHHASIRKSCNKVITDISKRYLNFVCWADSGAQSQPRPAIIDGPVFTPILGGYGHLWFELFTKTPTYRRFGKLIFSS
jgi:hypothetical protein